VFLPKFDTFHTNSISLTRQSALSLATYNHRYVPEARFSFPNETIITLIPCLWLRVCSECTETRKAGLVQ